MKNATILHLYGPVPDFDAVEMANVWQPPGPQDAETWGFVPSVTDAGQCAFQPVAGAWALRVKHSRRLLPAAVVNAETERRAAKIRAEEGRPVGRKERQSIKDEAIFELLPKAFITHRTLDVLFTGQWLVIGSATPGDVDRVCALLRLLLGSLKATPVQLEAPRNLTAWVLSEAGDPEWGEAPPEPFALGDQCRVVTHTGEARFKAVDAVPTLQDAGAGRAHVDRLSLGLESDIFELAPFGGLVLRKVDNADRAVAYVEEAMGDSESQEDYERASWTFQALWWPATIGRVVEALGGLTDEA